MKWNLDSIKDSNDLIDPGGKFSKLTYLTQDTFFLSFWGDTAYVLLPSFHLL